MTLREQASERLTPDVLDAAASAFEDGVEGVYPAQYVNMRSAILDALQPLFDQVEREKAERDMTIQGGIIVDMRHLDEAAERIRGLMAESADWKETATEYMRLELTRRNERDDLLAKLTQAETDAKFYADQWALAVQRITSLNRRLDEEVAAHFKAAHALMESTDALRWLVNLNNGVSKAGGPPRGSELADALEAARAALDRG